MVPEPMTEHLPNATLTRHPDGITAVDTEYIRPGLAAAHLIVQDGRAAFVDVGTNHSVPYLLAALDELGVAPDAVDFVLLTHVHLDHAGGAGKLIQALPSARVVVHPRGAPHLAQPGKLVAASIAVYGEAVYHELYGELVPVAPERMIQMHDGQTVALAGRELTLINTPGHALHHYCIVDRAHANVFTGDTFGISYRALDTAAGAFIVPTTTPTQFDPDQLIGSIERLMQFEPRAAYLMHYSRVTGLPQLAESLKMQIRAIADIARRHGTDPDRGTAIKEEMRALWVTLARAHGIASAEQQVDTVLDKDLELNTQGLIAWLARAS
jgi:glyoxylase-like metal-dependent hydrolase (beta-lactamase superfamily II)